jgi:hypothetical protein
MEDNEESRLSRTPHGVQGLSSYLGDHTKGGATSAKPRSTSDLDRKAGAEAYSSRLGAADECLVC